MDVASSEPTRNEVYEKVRRLLEAYYSSSDKGGFEVALEEYSLNGREMVPLIDGMVRFTSEFKSMKDELYALRVKEQLTEGRLNRCKEVKKKLETLAVISDGLTSETQNKKLIELLNDLKFD